MSCKEKCYLTNILRYRWQCPPETLGKRRQLVNEWYYVVCVLGKTIDCVISIIQSRCRDLPMYPHPNNACTNKVLFICTINVCTCVLFKLIINVGKCVAYT